MSRTYVDNAYNRRHGRVGLPVGSAVISKNTVCGINTKTYADNPYNRQLGRVGMSHGSAVVSKYSDGLTTWNYLDTDRQDRQVCPPGIKSLFSPNAYFYPQDIPRNMVNVPNGLERWRSNSSSSTDMDKLVRERTNVPNSDGLTTWNYLKTDRQVCPPGIKSPFTPKYTDPTPEPCKDVAHAWRESDNAYFYPQDIPRNMVNVPNSRERWRSNSSSSESSTDMDKLVRERTTWNTDRQHREFFPQVIKHPFTPKYTEPTSEPCKDVEHAWRESDNAYFYPQDIPRNMVNVPNSWERWRSNSSSSESSTDMDKLVREMTAAQTIVEELKQTELEISVTSPFTSNLQDGDIHELMRCRICHTDMESSSLTPCGHHFCTHCILQWLERKQSCPICRTRFRESNLIQDEEFDRIIGHFTKRPLQTTDTVGSIRNQEIGQYKQEIKQLKTQIQELKENKERQEANRQKTEHRYLQLATQLKKKTEQNQKLTYELDKVRKKDTALQKQIDTNVRQCDVHLQGLYELKENVLPERERTVTRLQNQLKEGTTESSDTEQAVRILKNEIGQQEYRMKEYQKLCAEKEEELTVLRKFVIPERESIIFQLQRQCKQLSARTHELERNYQLERTLSEE